MWLIAAQVNKYMQLCVNKHPMYCIFAVKVKFWTILKKNLSYMLNYTEMPVKTSQWNFPTLNQWKTHVNSAKKHNVA